MGVINPGGGGAVTFPLANTGATAATDAITSKVAGDAQQRFVLNSDGSMEFGPGNAVADAILQRLGVGVVGIDVGQLRAGFGLINGRAGGGGELWFDSQSLGAGLIRLVAGARTEVTGDLKVITAGKGLFVAEGANAKMGTAVLVAGVVTVNTTAVLANSRIFLMCQTPGGAPGFLRVSNRVAGTSFDITSSSGTDTSTVAWLIIDQ